MNDYLKHRMNHILAGRPSSTKKPKPIAKESTKRKKKNAEYRGKVKKEITPSTPCVVKSPVCTKLAQGFNHKQKRTEKNLMDDDNLEPSCNACNGYIEENPAWAKDHGHWVSRFVK